MGGRGDNGIWILVAGRRNNLNNLKKILGLRLLWIFLIQILRMGER